MRSLSLLAMALLFLLSPAATVRGGEQNLGVWMRLDLIGGLDPDYIAGTLRDSGVNSVFLLTPFPPREEEYDRIDRLDSSLGDDIDLHLWLTVFRNERYLAENPNLSFVSTEELSDPWINPLGQNFRADLIQGVEEMVDRLRPEGIFLDYFYVPLGPFDNKTLDSFSQHLGTNLTVSEITGSPDILGMFFEWRNDVIYETLRTIRRQFPGVQLSVFIIMLEEAQRLARGQDVARFAGIVDFIVPNTYHVVAMRPASWVGDGVKALRASGARDIWSGIQGYDIQEIELRKALRSALKANAEGAIIFRYGTMTEDHWKQVRRAYSGTDPIIILAPLAATALVLSSIFWIRRKGPGTKASGKTGRKRPGRKR